MNKPYQEVRDILEPLQYAHESDKERWARGITTPPPETLGQAVQQICNLITEAEIRGGIRALDAVLYLNFDNPNVKTLIENSLEAKKAELVKRKPE